jgi:predicted membrane protein
MRDMESRCRGHHHGGADGRIMMGIVIVIAGVLAFLNNVGVIHNLDIWDYWPVIFILIGIGRFFRPYTGGSQYVEGLILTVIGSLLLMNNLDLMVFNIDTYWPLLLVLVGALIIINSFSAHHAASGSSDRDFINVTSILGGSNYNYDAKNLKGGKMTAFMGGSKLDMRNAEMEGDSMVMDAFLMMGGMELLVPAHWRIVLQATPILGGVDDKTKTKDEVKTGKGAKTKELIVKGLVIMGGIDIKN